MALSWRFSALADRHRALGSKLEDWSGMGTAWTYDKDADEEYIAIRTKAGLMDVSGLKKVHITGPHASHLIDLATTRDVEKIYPGKSAYACMLNEAGKFTDDCILYRTGPNAWMVVHGSGTGHEELQRAAMGRDVSLRFDDNLHDLSLQGPTSVDYLAKPADADEIFAALTQKPGEKAELPENPMSADRVRWEHIQRVYEMCDRNVSETARRLNMHRRTLQRILAKRAPK